MCIAPTWIPNHSYLMPKFVTTLSKSPGLRPSAFTSTSVERSQHNCYVRKDLSNLHEPGLIPLRLPQSPTNAIYPKRASAHIPSLKTCLPSSPYPSQPSIQYHRPLSPVASASQPHYNSHRPAHQIGIPLTNGSGVLDSESTKSLSGTVFGSNLLGSSVSIFGDC